MDNIGANEPLQSVSRGQRQRRILGGSGAWPTQLGRPQWLRGAADSESSSAACASTEGGV